MRASLVKAAENNDFLEALEALKNPNSIHETNSVGMNALQVAILNQNNDLGLFLIEETAISTRHKDINNKDSLILAYKMASQKLWNAVHDRWGQERIVEVHADGNLFPYTFPENK